MLMWESEEEQVFQNYSSVVAWASRSHSFFFAVSGKDLGVLGGTKQDA